MDIEENQSFQLVKQLYKDEAGNPIELKPGQVEIFEAIAKRQNPRVHIMCFTRYGKSLTTALAILTRACTFPEKWAIVAGTKEKAKIIMNYVNAHIFDSEYTKSKFIIDKNETEEYIKRHRNKNHLTFDIGDGRMGEIFISGAKDALGFGAPNVVEDEAALVADPDHALVMRMLGDNADDNFFCGIGNPFVRNHFLRSFQSEKYHKINIDCYRGLEEGRITQDLIEEMRPLSFFEILYENKFPQEGVIDDAGWMTLILESEIFAAQEREAEEFGVRRLGVDVARGGRNFNSWVLRTDNKATLLAKDNINDTMKVAEVTKEFAARYNVTPSEIYVDDTGVGGGVTDKLYMDGFKVNAIKLGETESLKKHLEKSKTEKAEDYLNVRAYCYAGKEGVAAWLRRGGILDKSKEWGELTQIRYKKNNQSKLCIEPKEEMRKRGQESPDVPDALALTFAPKKTKVFHSTFLNPEDVLQNGVAPFIPGIG